MHEDKSQWIRLLMRACGMLSDHYIRNIALDPTEYSPHHICRNHNCNES
jgi:hypothetical protein